MARRLLLPVSEGLPPRKRVLPFGRVGRRRANLVVGWECRYALLSAGRPLHSSLDEWLARRLLVARSEGAPRFAVPPFGPGGRRRANQLVLSLPPYCMTPNNASGAAKPGTGPPNRTMKRTVPTPGLGSRDLP